MSSPIVNLDGEKFQWIEKGTDKPVYTIYAKSEKKAYKQLVSYLGKIECFGAYGEMQCLNSCENYSASATTGRLSSPFLMVSIMRSAASVRG